MYLALSSLQWHHPLETIPQCLDAWDRQAKGTDFGIVKCFDCLLLNDYKACCIQDPWGKYTTLHIKMDTFLFGVLVIQILCGTFHKLCKRMREIQSGGVAFDQKVPDTVRCRKQIWLLTQDHTLMEVPLDCSNELAKCSRCGQEFEHLGSLSNICGYLWNKYRWDIGSTKCYHNFCRASKRMMGNFKYAEPASAEKHRTSYDNGKHVTWEGGTDGIL